MKMPGKILTGIISVLLLAVMLALPAYAKESDVWDGTAATGFARGTGTESDPYIIETAEQLAYFAQSVNGGNKYSGKYVKLASDIVLNDEAFEFDADTGLVLVTDGENVAYLGTGINGDESGDNTVFDTVAGAMGVWYASDASTSRTSYSGTLNIWAPIGTSYVYSFSGVFDGDGHSIKGIYANSTLNYQALFGYTNNAVITNLSIENSYIKGGQASAGIVGYNYGAITGCNNAAIVCGSKEVGGISGDNISGCEIKNCHNSGTISGTGDDVGGIVGYNYGAVASCYNEGIIMSSGYYVGGVVGKSYAANGTATVTNCYNTGAVKGKYYVGGLVGENSCKIDGGYNIGSVSGSQVGGVVGYNSGTITNCYYLNTCAAANGYGTPLTYSEMKVASSYTGFDFDTVWEIGMVEDYDYPTLRSVYYPNRHTHTYAMEWSSDATAHWRECECGEKSDVGEHEYAKYTDNNCSVCGFFGRTTVWNGTVATGFAGGAGTKSDPYIIRTAEELAYLAQTVNEGTTYKGMYIMLDADIFLNDEIFTFEADTGLVKVSDGINSAYLGTGICGDTSGENIMFDTTASSAGAWYVSDDTDETGSYEGVIFAWTPIGMKIASDTSKSFQGSFDGGNHTVKGMYINSKTDDHSGFGLFGSAYCATVSNVGVLSSYIKDDYYVGGVVGYGENCNISSCYNAAIVNGQNSVGGVVGYNMVTLADFISTIEKCHNYGIVCGAYNIGGVIGSNYARAYTSAIVTSCYNTGTVSGISPVGGLVARSSAFDDTAIVALEYSHNKGTVYGTYNTGGVVGDSVSASLKSCYNIGNVNGTMRVGGIAGESSSTCAKAIIEMCCNKGRISGEYDVGGIVGDSFASSEYPSGLTGEASIVNCYNASVVSALNDRSGGIAGSNTGSIINCYSMGVINGRYDVGGIVGFVNESSPIPSVITSCYYLESSVAGANKYGASLSGAHMTYVKYFVDYDFVNVWNIGVVENYPYPTLRSIEYPNNHTHDYSELWSSDVTSHWHECECGGKSDEEAHIYDNEFDENCNACSYTRVVCEKGDVNGDGDVDTDDAIYLLRHTLLQSEYPVNQSVDFDGSGKVDTDDAIYLLRHTLLPSEYPLN